MLVPARPAHVGLNRRGMYTGAGIPQLGATLYTMPAVRLSSIQGWWQSASGFVASAVVAVIVFVILVVGYSSR